MRIAILGAGNVGGALAAAAVAAGHEVTISAATPVHAQAAAENAGAGARSAASNAAAGGTRSWSCSRFRVPRCPASPPSSARR